MRKLIGFLLATLVSCQLWAGATFSRAHNWSDLEVLTAADLNAEFNNILNNLDPAGIDDYSLTLSQMQTTVDPYPASAESLATDLKGEIERLRYQILQLKKAIQADNNTYWYQDAPTPGTFTVKTSSVGVNNTSPSYSLDVTGTSRISGNAIFQSSVTSPNIVVSSITSTLPAIDITTHTNVAGNLTVSGALSIANLTVTNSLSLPNSSQIIGTKNSNQDIPFNTSNVTISYTVVTDRNSEVAANIFTAKVTGVYILDVRLDTLNTAGIGSCSGSIDIVKNGSAYITQIFTVDGSNTFLFERHLYCSLTAGDTISIRGSRGSDGYPEAAIRFVPTTATLGTAIVIYKLP